MIPDHPNPPANENAAVVPEIGTMYAHAKGLITPKSRTAEDEGVSIERKEVAQDVEHRTAARRSLNSQEASVTATDKV